MNSKYVGSLVAGGSHNFENKTVFFLIYNENSQKKASLSNKYYVKKFILKVHVNNSFIIFSL